MLLCLLGMVLYFYNPYARKQKGCWEFQASQGYTVKPCLKNQTQNPNDQTKPSVIGPRKNIQSKPNMPKQNKDNPTVFPANTHPVPNVTFRRALLATPAHTAHPLTALGSCGPYLPWL